ncbi:MAG: Ltp family lipoprotein [Firmicutes bacterium]|nr:Ltp family lipoprotein [Bacillota bacterium]
MKYCTKCGVQLDDHSKFCVNCGQPVDDGIARNSAPQTPVATPAPKKKGGAGKFIAIGILIFAVIVAAVCFFVGRNALMDEFGLTEREEIVLDEPSVAPSTSGEEAALTKAYEYLNSLPFSYEGLVDQLEFEGFSNSEATYAANNCGADWYQQALLKAWDYLDSVALSYDGMISQLEYEGFTYAEALYGADNCGADWYEQAVKKAKDYLSNSYFTDAELIDQLVFEGFTYDQAVYGVDAAGI